MKKWFKKQWSNILFLFLLGGLFYTPSKAWFLRQISFSPSIIAEEDRITVTDFNWELKGINVPDISFKDTIGQYTLLSFWATWCAPCLAELPSIQKLYDSEKENVIMVLVSNESTDKLDSFLEKNEYNFPVYRTKSKVPSFFEHKSIPTTYLIHPNGEILIKKTGAANWNSTTITSLFKEE